MKDRSKLIFVSSVLFSLALLIGIIFHCVYIGDGGMCTNEGELYHTNPITNEGKCYQGGSKGPCGNLMVLKQDPRNATGTGVCQCDVDNYERAMIYHPDSNQCYFIFTQAFCEQGKWLTVRKLEGPVCDQRACDLTPPPPGMESGSESEMVPLSSGRCVKLEKHDAATCNTNQIVKFHRGSIYPSCYSIHPLICVGVPTLDCPEQYFTYPAGDHYCQPDFDFD